MSSSIARAALLATLVMASPWDALTQSNKPFDIGIKVTATAQVASRSKVTLSIEGTNHYSIPHPKSAFVQIISLAEANQIANTSASSAASANPCVACPWPGTTRSSAVCGGAHVVFICFSKGDI